MTEGQPQRSQPRPSTDAEPPRPRGWLRWLISHSAAYSSMYSELQQLSPPRAAASFYENISKERMQHIYAEKMSAYAAWAEKVLPAAAPDVFAVPKKTPMRQFLDMGAAPGGLSCFLHSVLGWAGVAVSLPESAGGMTMVYRKPSTSLRPSPSGCDSAAAGAGDTDSFRVLFGDIRTDGEDVCPGVVAEGSVWFAMAGAVQDQSQRVAVRDADDSFGSQLLQRVEFLCKQLHVALRAVQDGGSVMFVIGPSECATLVVLVHRFRPFVRGSVRVLATMHVDKSPCYVLLSRIDASDREALTRAANAASVTEEAMQVNSHCEVSGNIPMWFEQEYRSLSADLEAIWLARAARLAQHRRHRTREK